MPYYDKHPAGILLLIIALVWFGMEATRYTGGRDARPEATAVTRPWWRAASVAGLVAANVVLYLASHLVPAAAIQPGAVSFAVGLTLMAAGVALRGWAFATLGRYFTLNVMVSADQQVISSGPYRVLRHPSYTGVLLISAGVGLAAANWVSLAALVVLPLALLLWRIHVEEQGLLAALDDRYRSYAAGHKRLVPLVW